MVDVVANHMGIGDITTFSPFNDTVRVYYYPFLLFCAHGPMPVQSNYHDCNTCDSSCSISDWSNQAQVCGRVYVCACPCLCVCVWSRGCCVCISVCVCACVSVFPLDG